MSQSVKQREAELREELESFEDWKERYSFILDLGDELDDFPEEFRQENFLVKGCVSKVWLAGKLEDGHMRYWADSDSLFVKGLAGVLLRLYTGLKPEQILESESNFLMDSGLISNLSPNRANGAGSLLVKIRDYAKIFSSN